jgi:hypothetical protein
MTSANFLTVSDGDIARLDDAQLKRLIALIGRAELRQAGLGVAGLWIGGHQNAPDGGADVRISWIGGPASLDFASRRRTEVQCKATEMPAGAVIDEMRPKGLLRPLLRELIADAGAYVIASTETCSEAMLTARLEAMRGALAGTPSAEEIALDFYDAARLAEFANRHPGVALWLKEAIGASSLGWRRWGSWSARGRAGNLIFIDDDTPRALIAPETDAVPLTEAIAQLRQHLSRPPAVARIVGLSGLGKTRLAEALFDDSVGENALNADRAVYADIAASPAVSPTEAADRIARSGEPVIVVADNCPHDTHRRMTDLLFAGASRASLLTIDFDIDEDRPHNTLIVELAANSNELIDVLLQNRMPQIGIVDRGRIVQFSGGNARIALALANTALDGEGLAKLSEAELLDRLFLNQRRQNDPAMTRTAEAAALVYSFNLDTAEDAPEAEIAVIAGWAGLSSDEIYRHMAELIDRGLAQKRGPWRAVLPQALAAKLARRGFERVRPGQLLTSIADRPRLFMSFCKRLGLLHDAPAAVALSEQLMAEGGRLGDPCTLAGHELEAFFELAPASPDCALKTLERSMQGPNGEAVLARAHPEYYQFGRFLRTLAYEEAHFERALGLMVSITARERPNENHNASAEETNTLFQPYLSGTLASPSLRLQCLDRMLADQNQRVRDVAVAALDAMLTVDHWTSSGTFEFGARNRTPGWEPQTQTDVDAWYGGAIDRIVTLSEANDPLSDAALMHLSHSLDGLLRIGLTDIIAAAVARIRATKFWPEGWRSLCETLSRYRNTIPDPVLSKLDALEALMRPTTLEDRFSAFVLSEYWRDVDPAGTEEDDDCGSYDRPAERARALGAEIGQLSNDDLKSFAERATIAHKGYARAFGVGLFDAAADRATRWKLIKNAFLEARAKEREINVVAGYLWATAQQDRAQAHSWLDEIEADPAFAQFMAYLSANAGVDTPALKRLARLVNDANVPRSSFKALMMGRVTETAPAADLAELLRMLRASGPEGHDAAIDVLAMRFFGEKDAHAPELLEVAREILITFDAGGAHDNMRDHHVSKLAAACLKDGDEKLARAICRRANTLVDDRQAERSAWEGALKAVINRHPRIVLEEMMERERRSVRFESWLTAHQSGDERRRDAPIDAIPVEVFMDWVRKKPTTRMQVAATLGRVVEHDNGAPRWSALTQALLDMPEADAQLARSLMGRFYSLHWTNLPALIKRRPLIEEFGSHPNPSIHATAPAFLIEFDRWIAEGESKVRQEDESFE